MKDEDAALALAAARQAGASAAEALLVHGTSLTVHQRQGKTEQLERAEHAELGLRVFVGTQQATAALSDLRPEKIHALAERLVTVARNAPPDPHAGLATPAQLAKTDTALDLYDPLTVTVAQLQERAAAAEEALRAVAGVSQSDGCEASWQENILLQIASNGLERRSRSTLHQLSASAIAGTGTGMETDYDYASARHAGDLPAPAIVGRSAGERAVRRLLPRKLPTGSFPVVFEQRLAGSLLQALLGAIHGPSIARGSSFLLEARGQQIFAPAITIHEDPLRPRGLRSRNVDSEGLACRPRALVQDGVLNGWLLDLRSAHQLGMEPTGHASHGPGGLPAPSAGNVWLAPSATPLAELMADIDQGFYVTSLMGHGVNPVTGDYSRAASGLWIERGALTYPVAEMTIAGNLRAMFATLRAADDLVWRTGIDAPSLRVDGMMVAGA